MFFFSSLSLVSTATPRSLPRPSRSAGSEFPWEGQVGSSPQYTCFPKHLVGTVFHHGLKCTSRHSNGYGSTKFRNENPLSPEIGEEKPRVPLGNMNPDSPFLFSLSPATNAPAPSSGGTRNTASTCHTALSFFFLLAPNTELSSSISSKARFGLA